jgi:GNAT superfamily N-acetyltransferase
MLDPQYSIIAARPSDIPELGKIEKAAVRLLAGHLPESHLEETTDEEELRAAHAGERLWVACCGDRPVGFALAEPLSPAVLHLEEVDVHPDHGRRGLGAALVRQVCDWAARRGYSAVTLTTFRDLPWNMSFYARLGFEVVADDEQSVELREIVAEEASRGLDPQRRVVMRYQLRERAAAS